MASQASLADSLATRIKDHLRRNTAANRVERATVVVVVGVGELDGVPQVARLHLQLHAKRPLMVVRLRQLRPAAGAPALTDDALDDDFPRTACIPGVRATGIARV